MLRRCLKIDNGNRSATIVPTLLLSLGCCVFAALAVYGANDPSWWTQRGAVTSEQVVTNNSVVTTNWVPNPYAVVTQGQLKQFTARAADELNADLTNNGGAGPALSNLVYGWQQDYLTNGYATNTANPTRPYKSSDLQAVNVGQLKYIAGLVYGQLDDAGYTGLYPSWLASSNAADQDAACLGQIKEAFNFDLSLVGPTSLTASSNTNGVINLAWTLPANNQATTSYVEQQTQDGSWEVIGTVTNGATAFTVTNLASGEQPKFQIVGQNGSRVSLAQSTTPDTNLIAPSNVLNSPGATAGEIDVSWQNNGGDATYITVYQSADGVNWNAIATVPATTTSYAVTNLVVGQAYYFGVAAGNN